MDREGFRNRLKQYKEARGQNPQLKYWEWKETPKYEEGTGNVEEWDPRITAEGYDDKGYYAQAMNPLPEVVVTGSIEQNKDLKRRLAISKYLMGQFENIGTFGKYSYTPISTNLTQDIFLLSPEDQKKIMEQHGWRKVDINNEVDPYGLVRSSAKYHLDTHNEVPIYENTIDSDTTITRDQLTHLFNVYTEDDQDQQYTNAFVNANGYPTAIYFNPKSGKFYSRSYDLNDYGPTNTTSGFISTVNKLKRFAAKKLDEYGQPFVIRTGFEPLPQTMIDNFLANPEYGKIIEKALNHNIYKSNKSDKNKSFADGGEVDDNADYRQQIINRADYVASNYDDAKDFDLNPLVYTFRKFAKDNFDRGGISNCTLSATGWIDPNNQYMSAKNIFNNPSSGYTEIDAGYALPGDLLITKNPEKNSYHTMLIEGFNGNDPILRYSRGGHDTKENLVTGRSLLEYHELDNKQGGNHTEDHYFRYNIPNEYWLPELIVTPNKR